MSLWGSKSQRRLSSPGRKGNPSKERKQDVVHCGVQCIHTRMYTHARMHIARYLCILMYTCWHTGGAAEQEDLCITIPPSVEGHSGRSSVYTKEKYKKFYALQKATDVIHHKQKKAPQSHILMYCTAAQGYEKAAHTSCFPLEGKKCS